MTGLAERIDAAPHAQGIEYELIIADDDSPDETATVCRRLSTRFPLRLVVAEGRERALSLSVIDGIRARGSSRYWSWMPTCRILQTAFRR
ncbi:MAG: hypothetical protein U5O39_19210 [Gammaproteobacteria bacterium]|nr:hypothetical protein [Gammaproteobacteria bacterium]